MRWLVLVLALAAVAGCGLMVVGLYKAVTYPGEKEAMVLARQIMKAAKASGGATKDSVSFKKAEEELDEAEGRYQALPFSAVGAIFALLAGILAVMRYKWSAFLLLATAPVGPVVFFPKSVIFVGVSFLAALCALLIGQPKPPAAAKDEDQDEDQDQDEE
jgi:hypothetical protein